jgi:hypothetical protein
MSHTVQLTEAEAHREQRIQDNLEWTLKQCTRAQTDMIEQINRVGGSAEWRYSDAFPSMILAETDANWWREVRRLHDTDLTKHGGPITDTWAQSLEIVRREAQRDLMTNPDFVSAASRSTSVFANVINDVRRQATIRFVRDTDNI